MPMTPYLTDGPFDPEATRAMGMAFDSACQSLGLIDKTDALTKTVVAKIIEAAKTSERDPVRLHEAAMIWTARIA